MFREVLAAMMPSAVRPFLSLPGPYSARAIIEAVTRLNLMIRASVVSLALMPAIIVLVFWGHVPSLFLLAWWATALVCPIGQYFLVRRYVKHQAGAGLPDLAAATRHARQLSFFSCLDGFVWGGACLLILVVQNVSHQTLVLVMAIGNAAGSIFATSFWPATQYFFSIPAIGLAILALILVGDTASVGLAVALMAYLVALHFMVRQAYKTTMDGIQLQFENHDLVEELRAQTEVVEHANLAKSKFLAAASHDRFVLLCNGKQQGWRYSGGYCSTRVPPRVA